MSNIIKTLNFNDNKRVIEAKKIEFNTPLISGEGDNSSPQPTDFKSIKKNFQLEVQELQGQLIELQKQIDEEKNQAQQEIESWWSSKQQELESISEQMYQDAQRQGYEHGYQKGLEDNRLEFEGKLETANQIIEDAYLEKERIIKDSEPFLLDLGMRIAEKIIVQELNQSPETTKGIIANALQQVEERGLITLQVSAEDYELITPYKDELRLHLEGDSDLKILLDHKLNKGSCMIHTPNGSYNITLDSQLEEIKKHLMEYYLSKQE